MSAFASRIVAWQAEQGRHDLPWQNTRDPYRIWLSEVMLQQTQVATVIPYYTRFLARFPELPILAAAPMDAVLALWSGLGYYSRARNLHRTARMIVADHEGRFPSTLDAIVRLPGIGRSTAAAILVFSRGIRCAILDGNVKRVLTRAFAVPGYPGDKRVEVELWRRAEALLPERGIEAYTQGLMDLGARICTRNRPRCGLCPVAPDCAAHVQGRETSYPAPRPAKRLPERDTLMMILRHGDSVLLERRPPTGIWGGLSSLPEAPSDADVARVCRERFGVRAARLQRLDPVRHGFTHFRLRIQPVAVEVEAIDPHADEAAVEWLPLDAALGAALPAPVRKLLASICRPTPSAPAARAV